MSAITIERVNTDVNTDVNTMNKRKCERTSHGRHGHHGKPGGRHGGHHQEHRHQGRRGQQEGQAHHVTECGLNNATNDDSSVVLQLGGPRCLVTKPPPMRPESGTHDEENIAKLKTKIASLKHRNRALRQASENNTKNKSDEEDKSKHSSLLQFVKPGFGPRGHVWRHVIPTGPVSANSITARLNATPNGTVVLLEGQQTSSLDVVNQTDLFQRTITLPPSVNDEKLKAMYRKKFGGIIVVCAPRKGTKKHDKKLKEAEPSKQPEYTDCGKEHQEESSMSRPISKAVDLMKVVDTMVDNMETSIGKDEHIKTSPPCHEEEEVFEINVTKQNESAAAPQKINVDGMSDEPKRTDMA